MTYVSAMRTDIPEKLLKISDEIEAHGNANLTRLTVLKKWFDYSGRLPPFAIWEPTVGGAKIGRSAARALQDEELLLQEDILSENGSGPASSQENGQSGQQMHHH